QGRMSRRSAEGRGGCAASPRRRAPRADMPPALGRSDRWSLIMVDHFRFLSHIGRVGGDRKSPSNGMVSQVSRFATRLAYGANQLPRVAWYVGHGLIMRRLSAMARQQSVESTRPRLSTHAPVPDRQRLYADMAALFLQDLANVEAGIYPLPSDHDGSL